MLVIMKQTCSVMPMMIKQTSFAMPQITNHMKSDTTRCIMTVKLEQNKSYLLKSQAHPAQYDIILQLCLQ